MAKVVTVTSAQVLAAQMLVKWAEERGETVSTAIRKIAAAKRRPAPPPAPAPAMPPVDLTTRIADGSIKLDDYEQWLRTQLAMVEELKAARAASVTDQDAAPERSASEPARP